LKKYLCKAVYELGANRNVVIHDAPKLLNELLQKEEDESVTLVAIGQQNNFAALLERYPEAGKKIRKIIVMGGNFQEYDEFYEYEGVRWTAEFNVQMSIPAAQALSRMQQKIVYSDFNVGLGVLIGEIFYERAPDSPVTAFYRSKLAIKRPSWDLLAVLYAFLGEGELFSLSEAGQVHVDDEGRTVFTACDNGGHYLLQTRKTNDEYVEILNDIFQ